MKSTMDLVRELRATKATRYPAPVMRPAPPLDGKKFTPKGETGKDGSKRDVPRPLTKAVALSPEAKIITETIDELANDTAEFKTWVNASLMVLKARIDKLESAPKLRRRRMTTKFIRDRMGRATGADADAEYFYEGE